ncbi:MAG: hypothetical protein ACO3J3_12325, partial [Candidatus Nanopelagicales bacterium]
MLMADPFRLVFGVPAGEQSWHTPPLALAAAGTGRTAARVPPVIDAKERLGVDNGRRWCIAPG